MSVPQSSRLGDLRALARVVRAMPLDGADSVEYQRATLAQFCRMLGARFSAAPPDPTAGLCPRQRQTLDRLLAGDSEKQIAIRLGVSQHTIHAYVKGLYRHFNVNSRGELLARFVSVPPGRANGSAPR